GGVTMPLEFDGNDLPVLGEGRHRRPEREVDGQKTAVHQHQRLSARAMDLVVEVEPVDGRVAALATRRRSGNRRRTGRLGPTAARSPTAKGQRGSGESRGRTAEHAPAIEACGLEPGPGGFLSKLVANVHPVLLLVAVSRRAIRF